MLSEQQLELLTAFVDGEMTPRQREAALLLINESSEARSILQDLQENAHKLRELPRHKLSGNFSGQVLQTIADRKLQPAAPRRLRRWASYAAAASVLLALALGTYLVVVNNRRPADAPGPVATGPEQLHAPQREPDPIAFKDLLQQPKRELLAQEIRREKSVHLDVTVKSNSKAVERLGQVLGQQGIKMLVDSRAQASLRQGQGKQVFIYAENVKAEELEALLRQLAGDEPQAKVQGNFETVAVSAMSSGDRRSLSDLLGIQADELEQPKRQGSDLFDNKIIQAPKDNKTKKAAPGPSSSPDRFAMVLAQDAGGDISREVRQFLASRQQQRPGTMQVLLVIHQA